MADEPSSSEPTFEERGLALEEMHKRLTDLIPVLDAARQAYFANPTAETLAEAERLQSEASALSEAFSEAVDTLGAELGVDDDDIRSSPRGDKVDRMPREALAHDRLDPTADIDELLPDALDAIMQTLPSGWLDEHNGTIGLEELTQPDAYLSLTKGLRSESEAPRVHRLAQGLRLCRERLEAAPSYDHFAGATLVPSIVQLGSQLGFLDQVGGDRAARLEKLHAGPSKQVDSTTFELLVAARCAAEGRRLEFITEVSGRKNPDLKCHDPFPMVIECKRQHQFTLYELAEEEAMRRIFLRLREEARRLGVYGAFELKGGMEAPLLSVDDVVAALVGQRLAPDPSRPQRYPFGVVSLRVSARRVELSREHRLYSPDMLEELFDWQADIPTWDGICCSVTAPELRMSSAREPIALFWNNDSEQALNKRTWSAASLFGDALKQVPKGGFGMVYLAYTEGARPSVADRRIQRLSASLEDWTHDADFRAPYVNVNRLYPRPLGDGQPDLIESSVRFLGVDGASETFELFPATVFTRQEN